jgi:hypothetical protein
MREKRRPYLTQLRQPMGGVKPLPLSMATAEAAKVARMPAALKDAIIKKQRIAAAGNLKNSETGE